MARRLFYGRGGSPVPAGWAAANAGVTAAVVASSGCTVTIGSTDTVETFNETTQQTETTVAPPVYTGPAEVEVAALPGQVLAADDPVTVTSYEVTLPAGASASLAVGFVVTVTTSPDPMLTGRRLTVTGIERGTHRFSRTLYAELND